MEMHPVFTSVESHILKGAAMRSLIQFNPMDLFCLTVTSKGEGVGACAGTEYADPFPGLCLLRQAEPLSGHAR